MRLKDCTVIPKYKAIILVVYIPQLSDIHPKGLDSG